MNDYWNNVISLFLLIHIIISACALVFYLMFKTHGYTVPYPKAVITISVVGFIVFPFSASWLNNYGFK